MQKWTYIFIFLFSGSFVYAQDRETFRDSLGQEYFLLEGDTVPRKAIDLEEVYIFDRLKFSSREERVRYYILKRKTLKVYPYAKLASERLTELNRRLEKIESKSRRRWYTRRIQKYIENEFTDELKKLTRTEGQILVKLIHRQTGSTAFYLVKELRSGWRAFWYNNTAKMFKISLKEEYHPESVHEDYLIEDILQRAFAANRIERQPSVLDFDYATLSNKWKKSPDLKK
ncbi:DUF4294 domain-containing protein [Sinomicrobium weinanense]|uniref:DUF4294 domain-containing protein n=1 Tax=Sinomicrobium weinanense TaxID=2842200 RepID=A0A926JRB5_9FLAO|nr:DUF4294 domain-containing protein [Sinomicrobium weinanense]MBC9796067.1 DUF4294 domain-containing protein [Sinomicrobium weinanense]MBU3124736.1 DUF4294 domain-containing protein [Sinomicrobium weinanense]